MDQVITKSAARKIQHALRQHYGQGGWIVCDLDGNGGAWYSENALPELDKTEIKIECRAEEYLDLSVDEFADLLNDRIEQEEEEREMAISAELEQELEDEDKGGDEV